MKSFALAILLFTYIATVFAMTIDPDVPWDCPENEEYYKCSLERCETDCKDLKIPKGCPLLAPGCYAPACLCQSEMLRNEAGVCIPYSECE